MAQPRLSTMLRWTGQAPGCPQPRRDTVRRASHLTRPGRWGHRLRPLSSRYSRSVTPGAADTGWNRATASPQDYRTYLVCGRCSRGQQSPAVMSPHVRAYVTAAADHLLITDLVQTNWNGATENGEYPGQDPH